MAKSVTVLSMVSQLASPGLSAIQAKAEPVDDAGSRTDKFRLSAHRCFCTTWSVEGTYLPLKPSNAKLCRSVPPAPVSRLLAVSQPPPKQEPAGPLPLCSQPLDKPSPHQSGGSTRGVGYCETLRPMGGLNEAPEEW